VARNGRDTDWVAANSQWLSPLWVATGEKSSPPGLKAEHLLAAIESPGGLPLHACQLGVQAEGLVLWGGVRPTGAAQSRLGSPLSVKRLLIGEPGGPTRFIDPAETLQTLASLDHFTNPAAELTITAGRHSYRVSRVDRPAWAEECGRDAYGLYADLRIPFAEAAGGRIIQRMRYIEAGHFLMGSPVSEAERYESEGPQHRVTLTQGFWLADTTCTQALWRALMGNNPSHFKDDLRKPVENVSWDDVQGFLVRLAGQLAGVAVALPTEAEWEYTCRAGSEGPFNLGATISPAQANYEGNHPYTGGEKGEYRGKTVPVKTFPPNAWGLHEMHGNVWEWCADGLRDYDSASQENPRGPEDDASRVVRGGSWDYAARRLRSAYRDSGPRDLHNDGQGFRFSLRSIDQPAGAERLDQEIRPKGFEATEWPKAGPSVSTVFPGRKDGAASADAEAAPGAFAKLRKKVGDWLKAPGKGKQGDQR
jgi:formylglycine-generating enzyme required for sulfatase activity